MVTAAASNSGHVQPASEPVHEMVMAAVATAKAPSASAAVPAPTLGARPWMSHAATAMCLAVLPLLLLLRRPAQRPWRLLPILGVLDVPLLSVRCHGWSRPAVLTPSLTKLCVLRV